MVADNVVATTTLVPTETKASSTETEAVDETVEVKMEPTAEPEGSPRREQVQRAPLPHFAPGRQGWQAKIGDHTRQDNQCKHGEAQQILAWN